MAEKKDCKECDFCSWWSEPYWDIGNNECCCIFPWFLPGTADSPPMCNIEEFSKMNFYD